MKVAKTIKQMATKVLPVILVVALVSGSTPTTSAQVTKAKPSDTSTPAKSQTGIKSRGGPQEGIKVHGHWVIEVRNPDGTLVTRREFENALFTSGFGSLTLAQTLGRSISVGLWGVSVSGSACRSDPNSNLSQFCEIREPADTITGPAVFRTLSIQASAPGSNADNLVLSGTATAPASGQIRKVDTVVRRCPSSVAPANTLPDCPGFAFSGTTLAAPVDVVAGQIIQVTVTFSFA